MGDEDEVAGFALLSSSIIWRTSAVISGSSAQVGSSKRRRRGLMATARAMATRCFWPPLSGAGFFVGVGFELKTAEGVDGEASAPRRGGGGELFRGGG